MITEPTVFVLGAGASKPFGFPTGVELYRLIEKDKFSLPPVAPHNPRGGKMLVSRKGVFCNKLANSGFFSVDAFLEHRTDFIDIGKLVIACTLIPCETHSRVMTSHESNWYRYLFERMNCQADSFGENRVSFITFNYDRSLEHFLFTALTTTYRFPDKDAMAIIDQLGIVHLHGTLGAYDPVNGQGRDYEPHLDRHDVDMAANDINIIYDDDLSDTDPQFSKARELICAAKQVVFLGFGYHEKSMQRLRLSDVPASVRFLGSAYGKSHIQCNEIRATMGRDIRFDKDNDKNDFTVSDYLQRFVQLP